MDNEKKGKATLPSKILAKIQTRFFSHYLMLLQLGTRKKSYLSTDDQILGLVTFWGCFVTKMQAISDNKQVAKSIILESIAVEYIVVKY